MTLAVYLPPQALAWKPRLAGACNWLSGSLTCTDENFIQKAGAHRLAPASVLP